MYFLDIVLNFSFRLHCLYDKGNLPPDPGNHFTFSDSGLGTRLEWNEQAGIRYSTPLSVAGVDVSQEIPRRVHECIHRVCLPSSTAAWSCVCVCVCEGEFIVDGKTYRPSWVLHHTTWETYFPQLVLHHCSDCARGEEECRLNWTSVGRITGRWSSATGTTCLCGGRRRGRKGEGV